MNIMSLASLVEKSVPERDVQMKDDLKALQNEGERCARIVQGVLNFARENKPKYEEFDFSELMRDTALIFEHRLRNANVDLVLDLDGPLIMQGDSSQLQQVLVNVVINALHASQPGTQIIMRAREVEGKIMAEVLDSGKGISDDNLARAFSPFFTTKPEGSGTGLGLSVSYGIIRKHGGSIILENRPEGGVRVEIILPRSSAKEDKTMGETDLLSEVGNAGQ